MARIRTIKPDFFTSDTVSALPLRARLTWLGLWTHCDDHGRCRDSVKLIKAAVWPLDDVSLQEIETDLNTLADRRVILRYSVDGKNYLAVTGWTEHQKVNRPTPSKIPAPRIGVIPPPSSVKTHGGLTEDSRQEQGTGNREQGTGNREVSPSATPRANALAKRATRIPDDFAVNPAMVAWAQEHTPHVDGRYETAQFIDYWQAKAGKDAAKLDWVRTWQTWMRRAEKESGRRQQHTHSTTDQRVKAGLDLAAELRAESDQRAIAALAPTRPPQLTIAGGEQ